MEPIDRTAPWEQEHEHLRAVVDRDTYPELESGTVIENDLFEWRLQAAVDINNAGCEFMQSKDTVRARTKFEKALKYAEYNLKKFQANRELQDIRVKVSNRINSTIA